MEIALKNGTVIECNDQLDVSTWQELAGIVTANKILFVSLANDDMPQSTELLLMGFDGVVSQSDIKKIKSKVYNHCTVQGENKALTDLVFKEEPSAIQHVMAEVLRKNFLDQSLIIKEHLNQLVSTSTHAGRDGPK